jgi:protein N-terminal methyltransferase
MSGDWYERSRNYWSTVSPTIDGVLGGMEHVHEDDIRESKAFIESMKSVGRDRALDCGAGIGRISRHLLCPVFKVTDVMERSPQMLDIARSALPASAVGEFIADSMEHAVLRHQYDLIAIQWAAAYLKDADLASFLGRCKTALKPNGVVFLKDNISDDALFVSEEDCSRTRSDQHYRRIFARAGLRCIDERDQQQWPTDLFRAKMYALQ